MSRSGDIALDFGGGERIFRLGIGQIKKLQEQCGAGPAGVAACCLTTLGMLKAQEVGDFLLLSRMDVRNCAEKPMVSATILQGLLGGGMGGPDALRLVRDWVDERPLSESLHIAFSICNAAVQGVAEERSAGEPEAAAAGSTHSPAANSDSEKTVSMQSAALAASVPPMSTP